MIISDEQVQRVVEYLQTSDEYSMRDAGRVLRQTSADLVDRVVREVSGLPDVRGDRVEQARAMMAFNPPDSRLVAGKLIGRVLSDSLR
ncbi:MAG: hypothetical protein ACYC77_03385 [Coriobacteriia bacterium]